MKAHVRSRFWLEAGLFSLCGVLGVVTLVWPDWIEAVTGLDLDRHDGSFEWLIVMGLLLACVVVGVAARAEWRRPRRAIAR